MKSFISLVMAMTLYAVPCFALTPSPAPPPDPDKKIETIDKTPRMMEIEAKFKLVMAVVTDGPEGAKYKMWTFVGNHPSGLLGFVPVMVKSTAADKEVIAAMISASACAEFYDNVIKKHKEKFDKESPLPDATIYQ